MIKLPVEKNASALLVKIWINWITKLFGKLSTFPLAHKQIGKKVILIYQPGGDFRTISVALILHNWRKHKTVLNVKNKIKKTST